MIASGTPAELMARGRGVTLDDAFIDLLPEAKRAGHEAVVVGRVRKSKGRRDRGGGAPQRFGKFTAVDHVSFRIERGEIFGFLGSTAAAKAPR